MYKAKTTRDIASEELQMNEKSLRALEIQGAMIFAALSAVSFLLATCSRVKFTYSLQVSTISVSCRSSIKLTSNYRERVYSYMMYTCQK